MNNHPTSTQSWFPAQEDPCQKVWLFYGHLLAYLTGKRQDSSREIIPSGLPPLFPPYLPSVSVNAVPL